MRCSRSDDQHDAAGGGDDDPKLFGLADDGVLRYVVSADCARLFRRGIFNIFLLRQFYLTIPRDFDEAAYVDGANYWQIYTRIIFPLSRSAIIVVALFSFLASWNDFMGPLIYLKSDKWFTLALGLQMFQGTYTAQWDLLMAASATVVLPCVIVFLAGQRYFLEGITLTGLKG